MSANPLTVGGVAFACVFGGALLGMLLRRMLPAHHLNTDSKDLVKLGMGLVGTMAALVLGLLVASAKSAYDAQGSELTAMAANVLLLDRALAHYGPEAHEARTLLRHAVVRVQEQLWSGDGSRRAPPRQTRGTEDFYDAILRLAPQDEAQRWLQTHALQIGIDIGRTRFLLFEEGGRSMPTPFLVVVVFWLTIIFVSFGLFAPPNATVVATLLVCAVSVSVAIYLVLELARPFDGLLQLSSAPLRRTLESLGR
jgi:hypothetical protein